MADLGTALLYIAFLTTLATALVAIVGAALDSKAFLAAARHGMVASWLVWLAMAATLMYGLVTHDFSNKYIAAYTDSQMPFAYIVAGFWGGEKGALLLWTTVLSTFTLIAIGRNRTQTPVFLGWASGVLHLAIFFFAMLMVFESNPFETFRSFVGPEDGKGMNPLLQNPLMSIHPPSMLTGYMAFTLPFAFGVAALITGRLDSQWLRDTRLWTLVSWMFLSLGLILGGAWAYQELGWGGFWMWDPVENAGLIPWFTSTAFLHSVMIQERRDMLKRWNAVLVCLTFLLTIFGTFLTRSQLIDSVHAFADSKLASYFLWYMLLIIVVSTALIAWRWGQLRASAQLDAMFSRESFFVLNNVLLVGCAFVVIWGTMFSKLSAADGFQNLYNGFADALGVVGIDMERMTRPVELGEPWFNRVMTPIGLLLLLMTGIGPLVSWRRATRKNFERNFKRPLVVASLSTFTFCSLWSGGSIVSLMSNKALSFGQAWASWADSLGRTEVYAVLCVYFCTFVMWTITLEFHVGTRARMRTRSEPYLRALVNLTMRNKRRYGGYIVHIGIVLCFLAFTGNAFRIYEPEVSLEPGDGHAVGDYRLIYTGSDDSWEPDGAYVSSRATVIAMDHRDEVPADKVEAVLEAARRHTTAAVTAATEPGTPRIALTFASADDGKRWAAQFFAARLAPYLAVIGSDPADPNALQMGLGPRVTDVMRVTPRFVMTLFGLMRGQFASRTVRPVLLETTPGNTQFRLVFSERADLERFVADLRRPLPADLIYVRFNENVQLAQGAGRVDVVAAGVGMRMRPEVRFYEKHSSPTTEVAIESFFGHDLYLAMRPQQGQHFITLLAIVFPFVSFLWLGAVVLLFGGTIAIWPDRRKATARATAAAARENAPTLG